MKAKYVLLSLPIILFLFLIQNCSTNTSKITDNSNSKDNGYNETFHKTGWITDTRYRSVIFIITDDECKNSSAADIEEKIKFQSYKHLQKEFNPSYTRNASIQIKNLVENAGILVKLDKGCAKSNVYFYDIEKNELKADFEKIQNLK